MRWRPAHIAGGQTMAKKTLKGRPCYEKGYLGISWNGKYPKMDGLYYTIKNPMKMDDWGNLGVPLGEKRYH